MTLPAGEVQALAGFPARVVDVEEAVSNPAHGESGAHGPVPPDFGGGSPGWPWDAALATGAASLVVWGHPLFHNYTMGPVRQHAEACGVALDVIEGVSLLDNVSTLLGADFGTNGSCSCSNCRRYCRDALPFRDPQVTLVLSCLGYLADEVGDTGTAVNALTGRLLDSYDPEATVLHVVFGDGWHAPDRVEGATVRRLPQLAPFVDYRSRHRAASQPTRCRDHPGAVKCGLRHLRLASP